MLKCRATGAQKLNDCAILDLHRGKETYLVLAIVLLGVAKHPVAESQHVLEVSIALVSQILQLQH